MWTFIAFVVIVVCVVLPFFEQPRNINRRRTKLRLGLPRTNERERRDHT